LTRSGHHLFGVLTGLGFSVLVGATPLGAVTATAAAGAIAGGSLSPDMDQHRWWRLLDRFLPDEWLGAGGPLQHRGISHWWGLPLAALLGLQALPVHGLWRLALLGALVGWASHLLGDFVFGKASHWDHRGPGVPLLPWWGHVGLGLDSDGMLERAARWMLSVAVVSALAYLLRTPPHGWPCVPGFSLAR